MDEGAGDWRRKRSAMMRGATGWRTKITTTASPAGARMGSAPPGGLALPPASLPYSSWYSRQNAPIWITSPLHSLRGASTLSLFTHTPLKEFVSWMA